MSANRPAASTGGPISHTDVPWLPDLGDGTYRNPVIHADYSDPDLIRVGDDFFLVASSFNSMPGLPLLHSRDLVNWRLVNHVIKQLPWPGYELPAHGKGVWAPSLRHHQGRFYVYFGSPDEGVFMSWTDDPFGAWSPLVCVKPAIGWIDPCPFWDDDGQAYLVNAFANSRVGFKSVLRLSRMTPDGTKLLSEGRFIFDGQDRHMTMEGPKLYKRQGWYYIFAPAGGVKYGWQTVLRSRNIWGPYEDRIVLHQGNTGINGPHQGGWVETATGESWFMHFQDKGAYGRVAHLQPMSWVFDWPLIGRDHNNDGIGEPVETYQKPVAGLAGPVNPQCSDDFPGGLPGLAWQWQANPRPEWLVIGGADGQLVLRAHPFPAVDQPNLADLPHVLSQKFPAPTFTAETSLDLQALAEGDSAGLVVLGEELAGLAARRLGRHWQIVREDGGIGWDSRATVDPARKSARQTVLTETDQPRMGFRLEVRDGAVCRFAYRIGENGWQSGGSEFTARTGLWVGAKLGIYCLAGAGANPGQAAFGPFRVSALEE